MMESVTKPHAKVAIAFASALVEGDFARAHALLTPELQQRLTPDNLREELHEMYGGYANGEPKTIHYDPEFVQENWPTKRFGDLGWVYVGISGDDFVEAVTVVVADVKGEPLIREIEWGRP